MRDLLLLFIGAALGAVASVAASEGYGRIIRLRSERRRSKLLDGHTSASGRVELMEAITSAYDSAGLSSSLYRCRTFDSTIPFLVEPEWVCDIPIRPDGPVLAELDDSIRADRREDASFVAAMIGAGARIWDGEVLFVAEAIRSDSSPIPKLRLGRMNFFTHLSQANAWRNSWMSPQLQPAHNLAHEALSSGREALHGEIDLALSASAVVVVRSAEGLLVPLQRRSSEVVFWPDTIGIVPTFSFEPNARGPLKSSRSITLYNLFREMAEELYDLEDLIESAASRNASPDWIFSLPEVRALEDSFVESELSVSLTAIGVSPFDAAVHLTLLVEIDSLNQESTILDDMKSNWETTEPGNSEEGLLLVDLHDSRLEAWVESHEMVGVSALALDRARSIIDARNATD